MMSGIIFSMKMKIIFSPTNYWRTTKRATLNFIDGNMNTVYICKKTRASLSLCPQIVSG